MTQDQLDAPLDLGITEASIRQYEEDGVVCLRGLIEPYWIDRLREATARWLEGDAISHTSKGDTGRFAGGLFMWKRDPNFAAAAFDSPLSLIARRVMRSSTIRFFGDQLFVKEPGTQSKTPWHHDQTYFPVLGDGVCSIWVPMDPVTTESSGLEYIAGSHRWGRRFNPQNLGDNNRMDRLKSPENEEVPDIDANRDDYRILSWEMAPGDCLVHHSLALHGAPGNRSMAIRRRAHASRWLGDTARFRPTDGLFTEAETGLQAGGPMASPMFPLVEVPAAYRR